ncbi:MAG: acyl-CoA dehydrogenase family protein, partial [Acidimicrobiales bacterium]|nr:acyl-CoA dehydrogenase family protein [Acidimicrobiales bacterium]
LDLYRRQLAAGVPIDRALRNRVIQAWMEAQAYQLYTLKDVTDIVEGRPPGPRSSLNKLWWSEMDVRIHETALDLLGAHAELVDGAPEAIDGGARMK